MSKWRTLSGGILCAAGIGAAQGQEPPAPAEAPASPETTDTVPVAATAESAASPADGPRSGNRLIEEIVVTAQRREENLKDVPISISAFSADFMAAKGVSAQQDLPKITPGLTFANPVGFATAYIRGIGSDAFVLADPLVVTYVDGVYFPASTTQFNDFGDVEKVEIDKGPQGTLFGRNALGGVISVTTLDPSLTEPKVTLGSRYTSFTGSDASRFAWNSSAFISVPLTETLAFSVSGLYGQTDPYFDHRVGPSNDRRAIDDGYNYAFRTKLLWAPNDALKVRLNAYKFYASAPERQFAVNTAPSILATGVQPQDPFDGEVNEIPFSTDAGTNYFGSIDWETVVGKLQLLGTHQKIEADRNFDFDASPLPVAYFEETDDGHKGPAFNDSKSAEFRFLSNDSAPDWLTFVAGVYYFEQEAGVLGADFQGLSTNLDQGMIAGIEVPGLQDFVTNVIHGLPLVPAVLPNGVQIGFAGAIYNESLAYYTQTTFKFTDWVSLTLGARYTEDKRHVIYADQFLNLNADTQVRFAHYSGKDDPQYRTERENFDPKVSLNFRPGTGWLGDDPLLYLSYQTASIGNTFNALSLIQAPSLAKGSTIDAYEAGYKTYLFDKLVSLDAAIFYYKEKNPQTQVVSLQSGGAVHYENAGGLRTKGAELAIVARLFPELTNDGLVLTSGACYLDSRYTSYENASGFDPVTGIYSRNNDFTGNYVVQTPEWTISTGLTQTFTLSSGAIEIGADWYHNSGFYFAAQNTPNTRIESYDTIGINASWLYAPWDLRISIVGRNVTDEKYLSARFVNDFGTDDFPAQLSTWGASVQWQF
ncbi:MAG TPA: TonB-dependent receptor [Nevskiaceae bacterium]|nr:TonB-dependent receptor [Nevskiaceae bacterium]